MFTFCAIAQPDQSANKRKYARGATIVFDADTFDFGDINEGEKAVHVFKFKNTGKKPLLITEVQTSCGCISPQWTREPVLPGAYGTLRVEYDTLHKPGAFSKFVTVKSNAKNAPFIFVVIMGNVLSP